MSVSKINEAKSHNNHLNKTKMNLQHFKINNNINRFFASESIGYKKFLRRNSLLIIYIYAYFCYFM